MRWLDIDLSSKKTRIIFLLIAFFLPLIWLGCQRVLCMKEGENCPDAYYHVGMAERGPAVFCAKQFPQLEFSVWRECFADKELLFHGMLYGILSVQKKLNIPVQPPFHIPALFFMALTLAAFLFVLQRMDIAPPLWLPLTMLSVMITPLILFRFQMMRPHVFSLALQLLLCGILCKGRLKYQLFGTGLISLIYTWSYSNPQFILFPVLIFALTGLAERGTKNLLPIPAAITGILTGLTLHPQFPNTFRIWKIQSWDALLGPILTPGSGFGKSLMPPLEMGRPDTLYVRDGILLIAAAYLAFLILSRLIAAKGWKKISPNVYALALISLFLLGGTFMVMRTVEYAAPFTILFAGVMIDLALKEKIFLPGRDTLVKFAFLFSIAAIVIALCSSLLAASHTKENTKSAVRIGRWMEQNLPEKTLVVNLNWSDFAPAFQANRKQVFFWGMDPAFSLAADAARTHEIEKMLLHPRNITPRKFYQLTGSRYAFVLARRGNFIRLMRSQGWKVIYEADDGAVFIVE